MRSKNLNLLIMSFVAIVRKMSLVAKSASFGIRSSQIYSASHWRPTIPTLWKLRLLNGAKISGMIIHGENYHWNLIIKMKSFEYSKNNTKMAIEY